MKKCKITLDDGCKIKYFYLLPDSTLLHHLVKRSTKRNLCSLLKKHPEVEMVSLKRGQWIEAEWNGCHIDYDDAGFISTSFVRMIKASKSSQKQKDASLISVHFGWVLSEQIKFSEKTHDGLNVKILKDEDDQFEFSELFQDNETTEDLLRKKEKENVI